MIKISKLNFNYPKKKKIFNNFDLEIKAGDKIGICGKNGSGKSTLLKIILGIYRSNNIKYLKNSISVCPIFNPNSGLNLRLNVLENLYTVAYLCDVEIDDKIKLFTICKQLDLFNKLFDPAFTLSQGYRIRIFFVIFFYRKFDLILMDEYISFGDSTLNKKIKSQFNQKLKNSTLVIASHNDKFLKLFCSKIVYL